ncbi:MAG: hypothetical protein AB7V55_00290 [Oscillospiraceae bacterium]
MQDMETRLKAAEHGARFWRQNALEAGGQVLLVPKADAELVPLLLRVLHARAGERVRLLSQLPLEETAFVAPTRISQQDEDGLLALYTLYAFTQKLVVVSFRLPCGRKVHHLLQCGLATPEELIRTVLL